MLYFNLFEINALAPSYLVISVTLCILVGNSVHPQLIQLKYLATTLLDLIEIQRNCLP